FLAVNTNFGALLEYFIGCGAVGEPFIVVENGDAITLGWFFGQRNLRKLKWERERKEFYAKRGGNDKSGPDRNKLVNGESIAQGVAGWYFRRRADANDGVISAASRRRL